MVGCPKPEGGTSGFLMRVGRRGWLTMYLHRGRLVWKLGRRPRRGPLMHRLYHPALPDGYAPCPGDGPRAGDFSDLHHEVGRARGKRLLGMDASLREARLYTRGGGCLLVMVAPNSQGRDTLRAFWQGRPRGPATPLPLNLRSG